MLAFPNAAKIALIHLDEPFDGHGVLQLLGDELPKPMKEISGVLRLMPTKSAALRAVTPPTKNSANRSCVSSSSRQPHIRIR
jgi:hypothetical protein